MTIPTGFDPRSVPEILRAAEALEGPARRILGRLLSGVPVSGPGLPGTAEFRRDLVRRADRLLVADVPSSRLMPAERRRRIVGRLLDGLLDDWLAPNERRGETVAAFTVPAGGGAGPATGEPSADVAPDGAGLGVRRWVLQSSAGAAELQALVIGVLPGARVRALEGLPGFHAVEPAEGTPVAVSAAWDIADRLLQSPIIDSAEPAIRQLPEEPEEPEAARAFGAGFGMQDHKVSGTKDAPEWSLDHIQARAIWDAGRRGEGVVIGHIDTGYTRHPESVGNVRPDLGFDTWDDDEDASDDLDPSWWDRIRSTMPMAQPGHGTATCSVIASPEGRQDGHVSERHVCGTAPRATVMPVRATPTVVILPTGSQDEVARAIVKATERGAKVISMSLGSPWGSRELEFAVHRALDAGVIVCAAAGNVVLAENLFTRVTYPAAYPGVIAVAGCDFLNRPWRDSCRGPEVVVTAPGTDVWRATAKRKRGGSEGPLYDVGQGSGTSFAVATVAGVAACWLNYWGGWERLRSDLGGVARRIPAAFLACLRTHEATALVIPTEEPVDLPGYPRFRREDFGVGVLNVVNLLKRIPIEALSEAEAGVSMAPLAADVAAEVLAEFGRAFPEATKHDLRRALAREFGMTEVHLTRFLRRHGREVLHHVATSVEVRTRLGALVRAAAGGGMAPVPFAGPKALGAGVGGDDLASLLTRRSSPRLAGTLAGGDDR